MNIILKKLFKASSLVCLFILSACEFVGEELQEDGESLGFYQYVNLIPQSPNIEFVVDDESLSSVAFGEGTSRQNVSNTSYTVSFNQVLPNSENNGFIDDVDLRVSADKLHALILHGDTDTPDSFELEIDVSEILSEDFDSDYDLVQFVNLAYLGSAVDVYLLDEDDNLVNRTANYTLAASDSSGNVEVSEGTYKIVFTESGTDTVLAQKNGISIQQAEALAYIFVSYEVAGTESPAYSIVELNDTGTRLLSNEGADGRVRVANGISNTDAITVALGDSATTVSLDIELGQLSSDVTIPISDSDQAESVELYILKSEDNTQLALTNIDVYADDTILLLTAGNTLSSVATNDNVQDLRRIDTHAKLIFSHSIFDASDTSLNILVIEQGSNPDSFDVDISVGYLNSVIYEVEAGDYDVYVYDSNGNILIEHTVHDIQKGDVINLITTDFDTGGAPYQIYATTN